MKDFNFEDFFGGFGHGTPDGLRPDFKRTGTRSLDEAIAKCMDLADEVKRILKV